MTPAERRVRNGHSVAVSSFKDADYEALTNAKAFPRCHDENILVWLDASIHRQNRDGHYSINRLRSFIDSILLFTDADKCQMFIESLDETNKVFFMVSGCLGKTFLPKVDGSSQIYSIYIFCRRKRDHQQWVAKHEKVRGVFDDIDDVCEYLQRDKQTLERRRATRSNNFISSFEFSESIKADYNGYQADDYIQRAVISEDVPLSREENHPFTEVLPGNNRVEASETVTTYTECKQPLAVSDNGIWPRVSVIDSSPLTDMVRHLQYTIGVVQCFSSIGNSVQYVDENQDDPHFVVLSNSTNIEHLPTLFPSCVRRIYLYCSTDRYDELTAQTENYSNILSVMQRMDTLTRLILWDLSACIVDIANCYESEHQTDFAQVRYQCAYQLHIIIEEDLNDRTRRIESNRLKRLTG